MKYGKVRLLVKSLYFELISGFVVIQEYADLLKDSRIPQEWKESAIEYRQVGIFNFGGPRSDMFTLN